MDQALKEVQGGRFLLRTSSGFELAPIVTTYGLTQQTSTFSWDLQRKSTLHKAMCEEAHGPPPLPRLNSFYTFRGTVFPTVFMCSGMHPAARILYLDGSSRLPNLGPCYGNKVIRECCNEVTVIGGCCQPTLVKHDFKKKNQNKTVKLQIKFKNFGLLSVCHILPF